MSMRAGETPVSIPNTMVKPRAAEGTVPATVWESRWMPDFKKLFIRTLKTAHRTDIRNDTGVIPKKEEDIDIRNLKIPKTSERKENKDRHPGSATLCTAREKIAGSYRAEKKGQAEKSTGRMPWH